MFVELKHLALISRDCVPFGSFDVPARATYTKREQRCISSNERKRGAAERVSEREKGIF